ncbi:caspase family protein [Mycobacterium sp. AZCC_0083]|uniref:caspase family protein n=1 Tax=Mycobacterium sp. AZCC_0083 TaxID=2735882 RepID=UPI001843054B|nr:caspase family protein [Mycobacterium sp. AZCC_0083]MBB5166706.1 WD40 repeat protein [Mycobacterium sp. AZCC_0083]
MADDIARMVELFCHTTRENQEPYQHVKITTTGRSPTAQTLLHRLRKFALERTKDDIVVVYLTGHGQVRSWDEDRVHVLLTKDSDTTDLHIRVVKSSDVIEMLLAGTRIRRLLFILDTCYAGTGAQNVVADAVNRYKPPNDTGGTGVYVIVSSRPTETALPGVFTGCLQRAMQADSVAGSTVEWLALDAVMKAIDDDVQRPLAQSVIGHRVGTKGGCPDFLPNPRFRQSLQGSDLLSQERLVAAEVRGDDVDARFAPAAHWFTGRRAALEAISGWLLDDGQPQCLTVAGNAGSGKTALLAITAMLDDPERAPSVPRNGLPRAFPVGKGLISYVLDVGTSTPKEVLNQLAQRFDSNAESSADLAADILEEDVAPMIVLIDSLDEARDSHDLVTDLLQPLAAGTRGKVRFLLGTRPALLTAKLLRHEKLGPPAEVNLDGVEYADPKGIRNHVERILLSEDALDSTYKPSGAYRDAPKRQVRGVAAAIADAADTSFLIARIIATTESTRAEVADPNDRTWRESLPNRAADAIERDLEERLGEDVARARRLLLPLCYALGPGLPWEDIWPTLAQRLTPGARVTTEDLMWLRRAAGSYVVEGNASGRSVYRLFHRSLADHLRDERDEPADQRIIVETLLASVPSTIEAGRDWSSAHPYLTSHLATHAALGGLVDDLLTDPGFLEAADTTSVLDVVSLAGTEQARLAAHAFERAAARQAQEPEALHIAALQVGATAMAERLRELHSRNNRRWCSKWASWAQLRDPGRTVGKPQDRALAMIAVAATDGPAVVVATAHGIEHWKLNRSTPVAQKDFDQYVSCIAVCQWDELPAIAVGYATGLTTIHTLPDLHPVAEWSAHEGPVKSLAAARDRPLLVTSDDDGRIKVWSIPDQVLLRERNDAHAAVYQIKVLESKSGPVLISCGAAWCDSDQPDGLPTVAAWRLPSLAPMAAYRRADGDPNIVGVDIVVTDEAMRMLAYYASGTEVLVFQDGDDPVISLEADTEDATMEGTYFALGGGGGVLCRKYDVVPLRLPNGADGRFVAGASVEMDPQVWCGPFLINGEEFLAGCDRTIRLWRTSRITPPVREESVQTSWGATEFKSVCHGAGVLHAGSASGEVTTFHAESGVLVNSRQIGSGAIMALCSVVLPTGHAALVHVTHDGLLAAFDDTSQNELWSRQLTPCSTQALATARVDDGPVIIVPTRVPSPGSPTGWYGCTLLDAVTGQPLQRRPGEYLDPLVLDTYDSKALTCVAAAEIGSSTVVAAAGRAPRLYLWSLGEVPLPTELQACSDMPISAIAFSPGILVAGTVDGTLECWDTTDWDGQSRGFWHGRSRRLWTVSRAHPHLTCLTTAVIDERPVLVSAGGDRIIRVWELDGTSSNSITIDEEILSLDITPDGRCAVGTHRGILEMSV